MSGSLNVLSLFAGIGGFDLGLERTGGFRSVAFCEINKFCREVLAKHWPDVVQYADVRSLSAEQLGADGVSVDVLCGGFPCQDISNAGLRAGIEGERSGLWSEIARLLREFVDLGKPVKWVILENVSALLGRGLGRVLRDLAACGYDAEWDCIPASAVGAPHQRDRIWIVAYPRSEQHQGRGDAFRRALAAGLPAAYAANSLPAGHGAEADAQRTDTNSVRPHRAGMHVVGGAELRHEQEREPEQVGGALANPKRRGQPGPGQPVVTRDQEAAGGWQADDAQHGGLGGQWVAEPDVGRVAHGVPRRVDRLHALGNAVVPQIPELIGRAILAVQSERQAA